MSKIDIGKLKSSVDSAMTELAAFREKRKDLISSYVGENYGHNDGNVRRTPLNMLELAVNTYTYRLASGTPKADVTTRYNELKPSAETLRLALDYLCENIHLGKTLNRIIVDALFSMGIAKVGINDSREMIRGFTEESGQPFVEAVSLDDFVYDTSAKNFDECQFFGNRLFVDLEALKKSGNYKNLDQVFSATEAGVRGESTLNEMSTGRRRSLSEYRDRAIIWEIFLPFENMIVSTNEDLTTIIREDEWTGPRNGPYHFLQFNYVPDNIMPLPPASLWLDIHNVANGIWEKLFDQAKRQKTILPFDGGSVEDAKRIQASGDGDVVHVNNVGKFAEVSFGGPRQETMALGLQLESIFSRYAGNLDIAGGLSPQGKTATQDAILNQNSSTRFEHMANKLTDFVSGIMKDLAYWMWTDPNINLPLVKRPVKFVELKVNFNEREKKGEFLDYNFSIVPYSMNPKTPEQRVQEVIQLLQALYQPYAQLFAQSGVQLDVQALMKFLSEASGIPELNSILSFGNPVVGPVNTDNTSVDKPPTHSVYERINRPGASYEQQTNSLAQRMMGRIQPSENTAGRQML